MPKSIEKVVNRKEFLAECADIRNWYNEVHGSESYGETFKNINKGTPIRIILNGFDNTMRPT